MKRENTLPLNTSFLIKKIKQLDLKHIWLASKIGVDRRTIGRWTSGKVKRIAIHNLERLANCLNCSVDELIMDNELLSNGSIAEKDLTLNSIISDKLFAILAPLEKWDLLENIIKISIHPNVTPDNLVKFYIDLFCSNFMKRNFEQALQYSYKSLSLAIKLNDKRLVIISLTNIATVHYINGNFYQALAIFEYGEKIKDFQSNINNHPSFYNNLAEIYHCLCMFEKSSLYYSKALNVLNNLTPTYRNCFIYLGLANLHVELSHTNTALDILAKAKETALISNYNSGEVKSNFLETDIYLVSKKIDKAKDTIKYTLSDFYDYSINEYYCLEVLARLYRFLGNHSLSLNILNSALNTCKTPFETAKLFQERSRLALAVGDIKEEAVFRKKANRIFNQCKLYNRICDTTIKEYGDMFKEGTS